MIRWPFYSFEINQNVGMTSNDTFMWINVILSTNETN